MGKKAYWVKMISLGIAGIFMLGGCSTRHDITRNQGIPQNEEDQETTGIIKIESIEEENSSPGIFEGNGAALSDEILSSAPENTSANPTATEPKIVEADWSGYFDGLNGTAVLFDASAMEYQISGSELALTRRSPCSTFKIISSLIALENGIIDPEHSVRPWSGEVFQNSSWNQDIDFGDAFRASCVWYFREVVDEIGQELMQEELDRLMYGNRDISDWEGRSNTSNNNRALTGFWLESSLIISPKEQAEVLERIFGENSVYPEKTQNELKKVMLVEENKTDISIYGKTGTGMAEGTVVDAWFTGFAQNGVKDIYFCIYLGKTDDKDVSGAVAKEIAIRLVNDYFNGLCR